jgi:hypothetical protein
MLPRPGADVQSGFAAHAKLKNKWPGPTRQVKEAIQPLDVFRR